MKYNILSKFYIKHENNIIINNYVHKITIPYSYNTYNFLVYLEENIYFDEVIINTYKISKNLITLFLKLNIITIKQQYNSGIESLGFDSIIQNPPLGFQNVNDKNLGIIYKSIINSFYQSFSKKDWNVNESIQENINLIKLNNKCISTRKQKKTKSCDKNLILGINSIILGNGQQYVLYGSGGGFYSVSNIIIYQNDYIYLFDKYQQRYLYKYIPGIFVEYTTTCLIFNNETDFQLYTSHIILFSLFEGVFQKYGNRGYRYIQIESGSIGCLWRQYMNHYNIPYLELQGFLEQNIYNLFKKYNLIDIRKIIITHTIACG